METSNGLRRTLFSWLTQVLWLLGTSSATVVGLTIGPIWGLALLGAVTLVAFATAWQVVRWRAFIVVAIAHSLQFGAYYMAGIAGLEQTVGGGHWWHLSWMGPVYPGEFLRLMAPTMVTAAFIGPLLSAERGLAPIRRLAPRALPVFTVMSTVLLGLALHRSIRYPTGQDYAASLPVVATLPGWDGSCETESLSGSGDRREKHCVSPKQSADGFSIQYACDTNVASDFQTCKLLLSDSTGLEASLYEHGLPERPHTIVRDDRLGAQLLLSSGSYLQWIPPEKSTSPVVWLVDVRSHVAPPRGWVLAAGLGWLLAIACGLVIRALPRLVRAPTEAHTRWLTVARGDLAVVASAVLLVTHAFLVAALIHGFLT
ncbi:MAG: hypothetical protein U0271_13800 [Polyangiaceae bacterium]